MADANELVETLKRAALDAVDASRPVNVCFGQVETASPLIINVEQKMRLDGSQLVLSRNVTDFEVDVTVGWETDLEYIAISHSHDTTAEISVRSAITPEGTGMEIENEVTSSVAVENADLSMPHTHGISGRKRIRIHNALAAGEEVILIRQQGGQKFLVWDRIGGMA